VNGDGIDYRYIVVPYVVFMLMSIALLASAGDLT
jgi:hypothetical protein